MAETKNVKIVAVRPFMNKGKVVEIGQTIEVSEPVAADICGTNRALPATKENLEAAAAAAAAAKAAAAKEAKTSKGGKTPEKD